MPLQLQDAQVSVVGLGLMGGSLAAALTERRACRHVAGVARREETVAQALEMGIIHAGTCDLTEGAAGADIVVLATPVRTIIQLIGQVAPLLPPGCLLTDVGSTKQTVVQAMQKLPSHVQVVGGHPMCGRETTGLESIDPSLYEGATYVLTPLDRTGDDTLTLARELVKAIGARPLLLDASRHDTLVAAISHLPFLLAVGLVATAKDLSDDALWKVAASGFRDTSRLAASDETMMLDILLTNRKAMSQALSSFQKRLARLARLLEMGDETGLHAAMTAAAQQRRRFFQ